MRGVPAGDRELELMRAVRTRRKCRHDCDRSARGVRLSEEIGVRARAARSSPIIAFPELVEVAVSKSRVPRSLGDSALGVAGNGGHRTPFTP